MTNIEVMKVAVEAGVSASTIRRLLDKDARPHVSTVRVVVVALRKLGYQKEASRLEGKGKR